MGMTVFKIAFSVVAMMAIASGAWASLLAEYSGMTDPLSQGWALADSGAGDILGPGSEVTSSGPHDYWRIRDNTSAEPHYIIQFDEELRESPWQLIGSVRVVEGDSLPYTVDVPNIALIVSDGLDYWSWYIGDGFAGPVGVKTKPQVLARKTTLDTTSDYREYRIDFSPNAPGSADDTANFYIDGVLVFENVSRAELFNTSATSVRFGAVATGGTGGDVHYEQVSLLAPMPADLDFDGDVDGVDLGVMFANFNGPGGGIPGNPDTDLDNDGDVDGVDLAVVFALFTGPLAPASVPEPSSLVLLGGLLTLGLSRRL